MSCRKPTNREADRPALDVMKPVEYDFEEPARPERSQWLLLFEAPK